jgi:hypothetical protein
LPRFLGWNTKQLLKPVILYPLFTYMAHPVLTNEDRTNQSNRQQFVFNMWYNLHIKLSSNITYTPIF